MPESKTDHGQIKPALFNELQVQALKNELFGHPGDRSRYIPCPTNS